MGVSELFKISVILPRSELPEALKDLGEFKYFHASQPESRTYDPLLDELSSRSFRIYIALRDLVRDLGLKIEPGIIDILRSGYSVPKETIIAGDWKDLAETLESDSTPIIEALRESRGRVERFENSISNDTGMAAALAMLSNISVDFTAVSALKRFMISVVRVQTKDIPEIVRSLPFALVETSRLSGSESLMVVGVHRTGGEQLAKVLRSFETESFSIPPDLPQNPVEAYKVVSARLVEAEKELQSSREDLKSVVSQNESRLLALYEASNAAFESLESVKRTGDLKRFAVINGFIPAEMEGEFKKRFGRWITQASHVGYEGHGHEQRSPATPTLMRNRGLTSAFENIVLTQGPPNYNELDPTPVISFVFPLFYGMMFGDVGHGIVLALFGLLLIYRKAPGLVRWGQMFVLGGISATIFGVLIGEAFGLEIYQFIPAFGHPMVEFVERLHEIPSININALRFFLKLAILVGIFHIYTGLILGVVNSIKNKEHHEVIAERIPTMVMYTGFISLMFSFLGTGYNVGDLFTSTRDAPLFFFFRAVPIATMSLVGSSLLLGGLAAFIMIKPILMITGKIPKDSIAMTLMINVIDGGIEKIAGFLSNTLSYSRLAILLTVHSSLLIVVNLLWNGIPFPIALPLVIIFNILVIMMEGMIVFIQDLRLHLYEWFTKFYSGSGVLFRPFVPSMVRAELEWQQRPS